MDHSRGHSLASDLRSHWRLLQILIDRDMVSSQWAVDKALSFIRQHLPVDEHAALAFFILEVMNGE